MLQQRGQLSLKSNSVRRSLTGIGAFLLFIGFVNAFGLTDVAGEGSTNIRTRGCDEPEKAVTDYFQAIYDEDSRKLASYAAIENEPVVQPIELSVNQPKIKAKPPRTKEVTSPEDIGRTWITVRFPDFVRKRRFVRFSVSDVKIEGNASIVTTSIKKESGLVLKIQFNLVLQQKCWRIRDISISTN